MITIESELAGTTIVQSPENLNELKLNYKDVHASFTDATIITRDGFVKAHKALLSYLSPILRDTWTNDPFASLEGSVIIPDITTDMAKAFVSLVTTGTGNLRLSEVDAMVAFMKGLGMDSKWMLHQMSKKETVSPRLSMDFGDNSNHDHEDPLASLDENEEETPQKTSLPTLKRKARSPSLVISKKAKTTPAPSPSPSPIRISVLRGNVKNRSIIEENNTETVIAKPEGCAICNGKDKKGKPNLGTAIDFDTNFIQSAFHTALCYLRDFRTKGVNPPAAFNALNKPLVNDKTTTYDCNYCTDVKQAGFKEFFVHNAIAHGLLASVMASDSRISKTQMLPRFLANRTKFITGTFK